MTKKTKIETAMMVAPIPKGTNEPSVAAMLQSALASVQSGQITTQHVEVVSKMMDLYERDEKRRAEKDFAQALVDLQAETGAIAATKPVHGKDGSVRYHFAPYEEIMATARPILSKHGFSLTFDTECGEGRLTSICTLTHKAGHSRQNRFAVRYSTPPGASDAQGDMSTKSYAKRGALCDALNIVIDHDDDARLLGKVITPEEADALRERCASLGVETETFLNYAHQVASGGTELGWFKIPESIFDTLLKWLDRKEKAIKLAAEPKPANWPDITVEPPKDSPPAKKYVEEKDPKTGEYLI